MQCDLALESSAETPGVREQSSSTWVYPKLVRSSSRVVVVRCVVDSDYFHTVVVLCHVPPSMQRAMFL